MKATTNVYRYNGRRLLEWSRRQSTLGGYIVTLKAPAYDGYLGEYVSASMPVAATVYESGLELLEAGQVAVYTSEGIPS